MSGGAGGSPGERGQATWLCPAEARGYSPVLETLRSGAPRTGWRFNLLGVRTRRNHSAEARRGLNFRGRATCRVRLSLFFTNIHSRPQRANMPASPGTADMFLNECLSENQILLDLHLIVYSRVFLKQAHSDKSLLWVHLLPTGYDFLEQLENRQKLFSWLLISGNIPQFLFEHHLCLWVVVVVVFKINLKCLFSPPFSRILENKEIK